MINDVYKPISMYMCPICKKLHTTQDGATFCISWHKHPSKLEKTEFFSDRDDYPAELHVKMSDGTVHQYVRRN